MPNNAMINIIGDDILSDALAKLKDQLASTLSGGVLGGSDALAGALHQLADYELTHAKSLGLKMSGDFKPSIDALRRSATHGTLSASPSARPRPEPPPPGTRLITLDDE